MKSNLVILGLVVALMALAGGNTAAEIEEPVPVLKASLKHQTVYGFEGLDLNAILLITPSDSECLAILYGTIAEEKVYISSNDSVLGTIDGVNIEMYLSCFRSNWTDESLADIGWYFDFYASEEGQTFREHQQVMMSARNLKNPKGNGTISDYLGEDTIRAPVRVNGNGTDKIGATYGQATAKTWGKFSDKTWDYKQLLSDIRDWLESKGYQDIHDLLDEPI